MSSIFLSLSSNIASLKAKQSLSRATESISSIYEKLSSGLRINKASEDAAGLSVSMSLASDKRIYNQAVRNLNDGLSALNIADSSAESLSIIVTRLQELAEQSSNGTLSSGQREALDAEAQALADEYERITSGTTFNGIHLLDGSSSKISLQAGYGCNAGLSFQLAESGSSGTEAEVQGGDVAAGTFTELVSYDPTNTGYAMSLVDLDKDGALDMVTAGATRDLGAGVVEVRIGNGDGTFGEVVQYAAEPGVTSDFSLADLNNDGKLDMVSVGYLGLEAGSCATVRIGNGDGTFGEATTYSWIEGWGGYSNLQLSDVNNDNKYDLVTMNGEGAVTIRSGLGDGSFAAETTSFALSPGHFSLGDLNDDGNTDFIYVENGTGILNVAMGNGDGTFGAAVQYGSGLLGRPKLVDINNDGNLDVVAGESYGRYSAFKANLGVLLGQGDGTFAEAVKYSGDLFRRDTFSVADLNSDGNLDIITCGMGDSVNGAISTRFGKGDGTFEDAILSPATAYYFIQFNSSALGDLDNDGFLELAASYQAMRDDDGIYWGATRIFTPDITAGVSEAGGPETTGVQTSIVPAVGAFSLKTRADSLAALPVFQETLDRLSVFRGNIGAFESRIAAALATARTTALQYSAAESRIKDIDMAESVSVLMREEIIQNSAATVLAQANQTPALALILLGN